MYYRITRAMIAFLAITVLFSGCGGGSNPVGALSTSATTPTSSLEIQYVQPVEGDGLRQQVDYDYDYSQFASAEGFTAVPMAGEFTPANGSVGAFTMQVVHDGADRMINIDCSGAGSPLVHLRYDPETWQVNGVGVLNPFDTEGYVTFVDQPAYIA